MLRPPDPKISFEYNYIVNRIYNSPHSPPPKIRYSPKPDPSLARHAAFPTATTSDSDKKACT